MDSPHTSRAHALGRRGDAARRTVRAALPAAVLITAACAGPRPLGSPQGAVQAGRSPDGYGSPVAPGARLSGAVGVMDLTGLDIGVAEPFGETVSEDELTLPFFAANLQSPFRRERLELGWEAGFSIAFESERDAVVIDDGTALIVSDNDLRLSDISGGLYAALNLGERVRVHGGAGPLFQIGSVELELGDPINGEDELSESGVGLGYYARVGADFYYSSSSAVGVSIRWIDSEVNLGGTLDDLQIDGLQYAVVFTTFL
ncbi:MAG: hypothetical protein AAFZ65_11515 [Planctomycetota bacterium]